jgi:hypothetical protein
MKNLKTLLLLTLLAVAAGVAAACSDGPTAEPAGPSMDCGGYLGGGGGKIDSTGVCITAPPPAPAG